ncbi:MULTISPECIES: hypothetical protein [Cereibacter]|uniref:hypothetical protein n=1 Tax=Cereibacter TaxID=1653176 RepID=UPI000DCBE4FA|nr:MULTISPECIES: hypothetical protein [Cereibacter]MWP38075.1 hypothetical protein [Cereibacter sphaeroides]RAZ84959.1 hypothetical protein DDV93_09860 [Cereibacter johrii]
MTEKVRALQPGPIFYDVFLGYLRVLGTNLKDWCAPHGVAATNAKSAATGAWNGAKARALRQKMIDEVGEETFRRLYADRMRREAA